MSTSKKQTKPIAKPTEPIEEEIFIGLEDKFDWKRVVVGEPVTHNFTKGDTTIEWTTSDVWVAGPDKKKLPIYVELAEQKFWGIGGTWPIGTNQEDRSLDTLEGFQISYPLTSISTIDAPTVAEKATRRILDQMWNITVDALKNFCGVEKEKRKVPAPTYSSYTTAKADKDWTYAVKPTYEYAITKDEKSGKKFADKTKPMRTYIKFVTKGKGKNIRCETKIFGPGDKQVSPFKYMSRPNKLIQGNGHPVVHWDGIFWGSHGQKSSYGASVRLRVAEMNFTPVIDNTLSNRRMLAPNSAPPEIDVSDDEGGDGFTHPMGGEIQEKDFQKDGDNVNNLLKGGMKKQTTAEPSEIEGENSEPDMDDGEGDDEPEEEFESPPESPPKNKRVVKKSSAIKKQRDVLLAKRRTTASKK